MRPRHSSRSSRSNRSRSARSRGSRASRRSSVSNRLGQKRPLPVSGYHVEKAYQIYEKNIKKPYALWNDTVSRERFTASKDEFSGLPKQETDVARFVVSPPPTVKRRWKGHTRSRFRYNNTPNFSNIPLYDNFEEEEQKKKFGEVIYCSYSDANKPPVQATRQCLDCAVLDRQKAGYYCEEEFHKAHPWYRKTHEWIYVVQRPGTPEQKKMSKGEKTREAAEDLLLGIHETKEEFKRGDIESTKDDTIKAAASCDQLLGRMLELVALVRNDSMRKETYAAKMIQRMFHMHRAWSRLKTMFRIRYQQALDEETNMIFYVDRRNDTTRLHKPTLFGQDIPLDFVPLVTCDEMTEEEAAHKIQGMYRTISARSHLRQACRNIYRIIRDKSTGKKYYFNKLTGETTWKRPILLGPESKPRKRIVKTKQARQISPLSDRMATLDFKQTEGQLLPPDQAVIILQRFFRKVLVRLQVLQILPLVYEKILDPDTGFYFYYNTRLEYSVWNKPFVFGEADIYPQESTQGYLGGKTAENMTQEEAATIIQTAWRAMRARMRFSDIVRQAWTQHVDQESGLKYFINHKTGESSWEAPYIVQVYLDEKETSNGFPFEYRSGRFDDRHISPIEAAAIIQTAFRKYYASVQVYRKATEIYEKLWDEDKRKYYYFNRKTLEYKWTKPTFLGKYDLEPTPLKNSKSKMYRALHRNPPRFGRSKEELSVTLAATKIQAFFRYCRDKKSAEEYYQTVFEKIWDEGYQKPFFFNSMTLTATWTPSKLIAHIPFQLLKYKDSKASHFDIKPLEQPERVDILPEKRHKVSSSFKVSIVPEEPEEVVTAQNTLSNTTNLRNSIGKVSKEYRLAADALACVVSPWACARAGPGALESRKPSRGRFSATKGRKGKKHPDFKATVIQSFWRRILAQRQAREVTADTYTCLFDNILGQYYYFNQITGVASWDEPQMVTKLFSTTCIDPTSLDKSPPFLHREEAEKPAGTTFHTTRPVTIAGKQSLLSNDGNQEGYPRPPIYAERMSYNDLSYEDKIRCERLGVAVGEIVAWTSVHEDLSGNFKAEIHKKYLRGFTLQHSKSLPVVDFEKLWGDKKINLWKYMERYVKKSLVDAEVQKVKEFLQKHHSSLKSAIKHTRSLTREFNIQLLNHFFVLQKEREASIALTDAYSRQDLCEIERLSKDLAEGRVDKYAQVQSFRDGQDKSSIGKGMSSSEAKSASKLARKEFYSNLSEKISLGQPRPKTADMEKTKHFTHHGVKKRNSMTAIAGASVFGSVPSLTSEVRRKPAKSTPRPGRKRLPSISKSSEEATRIAAVWRGYKTRLTTKRLAQQRYVKVFDPTHSKVFYYNPTTRHSSWFKPIVLQDSDVRMTPRLQAPETAINPDGDTSFSQSEIETKRWSAVQAATEIQRLCRGFMVRHHMAKT